MTLSNFCLYFDHVVRRIVNDSMIFLNRLGGISRGCHCIHGCFVVLCCVLCCWGGRQAEIEKRQNSR
jgi:hypothetical protein